MEIRVNQEVAGVEQDSGGIGRGRAMRFSYRRSFAPAQDQQDEGARADNDADEL